MKGPSQETMRRWWTKAAYIKKGRVCRLCIINGDPHPRQACQVHHYVHRRNLFLRWDVENGIPLCPECHNVADLLENRDKLRAVVDYEYLRLTEQSDLKQHLVSQGMTIADFNREQLEKNKKIVESGGQGKLFIDP